MNSKAVENYLTQLEKAKQAIERLSQYVDDFGEVSPDEVTYAHAGSMEPTQRIDYLRLRSNITRMKLRYDPDHDINTSPEAPPVTHNEMTLAMIVEQLINEIEHLANELEQLKDMVDGTGEYAR